MLAKADELVELVSKHLNGNLTTEQSARLDQLIAENKAYRNFFIEFTVPEKFEELLREFLPLADSLEKPDQAHPAKLVQRKWFWRISAAASVFLILSFGAYIWFSKDNNKGKQAANTELQPAKQKDLAPGKYKAVLTLAGGEKIILDSAKIGALAKQGNTTVVKEGGQLIYDAGTTTGAVLYNTLSTAKGEIYSLALSDNSKVWLNSASSIRFPVAFKGRERKVEITGEAYFEVTHNRSMPFKVSVNGIEIEVVGTSFNVNSYPDEPNIKTSLLEGIVKVNDLNNRPAFLKPGQQAQVTAGEMKVINDADMQQTVAWKNGYFQFNRDDLQTVMRQIARWYDVEVVYEGNIPKREFWGKIHRNTNASEALKILERSRIHFRIEGKTIIVTP